MDTGDKAIEHARTLIALANAQVPFSIIDAEERTRTGFTIAVQHLMLTELQRRHEARANMTDVFEATATAIVATCRHLGHTHATQMRVAAIIAETMVHAMQAKHVLIDGGETQ